VECDSANVTLINVLMDLEQIGFMIEMRAERLPYRGQLFTANYDHRPMNLGYRADMRFLRGLNDRRGIRHALYL
jgi:hypothetical protein